MPTIVKRSEKIQTRASGVIKHNKNDSVIIVSVLFSFTFAQTRHKRVQGGT